MSDSDKLKAVEMNDIWRALVPVRAAFEQHKREADEMWKAHMAGTWQGQKVKEGRDNGTA